MKLERHALSLSLSLPLSLAMVLLAALAVRLVTYNGSFGSDDLTYFDRAAAIAGGLWTSADYNGSLRYGFNLPAAAFMALFGRTVFVANLWPLCCSLIEVAAVFAFASAAMSRRAGVCAALLLATAPLHMAVATRIHADPVVSMFVTLGFVLLYFGAVRRQASLMFAAGLAIGGIFWAKELAAVTWFAFLPMLWFFRAQFFGAQWRLAALVVAGTVFMMVMNGALMAAISGDPLHAVRVVTGAMHKGFVAAGPAPISDAAYYLRYLFIDLRHLGWLAYFALASAFLVPRWLDRARTEQAASGRTASPSEGYRYALVWCLGLIAVLSVLPVSLSPLRFPNKQSNYVTLFMAPVAVLAGMAIAALPVLWRRLSLALCLVSGLLLGALEQADYRVFTANTKALVDFAASHRAALFIGSTNNASLGDWLIRFHEPGGLFGKEAHSAGAPVDPRPAARIRSFREYEQEPPAQPGTTAALPLFAVLDRETLPWNNGRAELGAALPCWRHVATLVPVDLANGNALAMALSRALASVPPAARALDKLARPAPAEVYQVDGPDALCRGNSPA